MNTAETSYAEAQRWSEAQGLFEQALERPPSERTAYVRHAAGEDTWLRASVLDLLARDDASSPLDRPLQRAVATPAAEKEVGEGDQLDNYRLCERIGVGGMGSVFRAESFDGSQRQPLAVKVLHTNLNREAQHRFVQEQRILADLHHPRIVRLQDFGTTATGITYLVMNLVEGTAITAYADAHKLVVVARLRLFLQVCDAVRYPHGRLVVHRDLKPANILVNGEGEAQLLDFGIAKVLAPEAHLGGTATRTELRVMTPSYASPEQLLGRSITTSTDVWSLGVLLFELLTGHRPFDWSGMSLVDIERRLELAPRPKASASFASADGETYRLAQLRSLDPRRLRRRLRGDLDLIIDRSLAYRPGDRYGSVEALAQDLERYLAGKPILARRPSLAYTTGKFLRRHAMIVSALVITLLSLVGFAVLQVDQSRRLTAEQNMARQQRDKAEMMSELLSSVLYLANPVNRELNRGAQTLLADSKERILTDFGQHPEAQADMLTRIGTLYRRLGDYDEAEALLTQASEIWEMRDNTNLLEAAKTLDSLGFVYHQKRDPRARPTLRRALKMFWQAHGGEHLDVARSLMHLAVVLRYNGELRKAEALLRRAIAMDVRLGNEAIAEAGARLADLAGLVGRRGERQESLALYDQALEIQRATWGPRSVAVGLTLNRKAGLFQERPRAEEGARLLHAATEIFRDRLGDDHQMVATGLNNLANTYVLLGDYEKAERFQRQAWERDLRSLGAEHPSTLDDRRGLAMILRETGRLSEAEGHLRHAVAALARVKEADHPALLSQRNDFARVLLEQGQADKAAEQLDLALNATISRFGDEHRLTGSAYIGLAEWALQKGNLETALTQASAAVRIFESKKVGAERWRLGEAQSALGAALVRSGSREEGALQLRAAVASLRALRGPSVATRLAEARLEALGSP